MIATRSSQALFAGLLLGAGGLLILGVQPLLYGAYVHDGTISEVRLGLLASVEIAAIAAGSAAGIALSRSAGLRLTGIVGAILLIVGNLAPFFPLFGGRMVAGFGGGLLVALAAQMIAARPNVNAPAGAFMFLQAATQYIILQWFSASGEAATAWQVQLALAALVSMTVPLIFLLPRRPNPSRADTTETTVDKNGVLPVSGFLALLAAGLFVGAAVGIWAYLGLWLEGRGVAPAAVNSMLTLSMVGQIFGALTAMWIGERGHSGTRVVLLAILMMVIVGLLYLQKDLAVYGRLLVIGYGFIWMVATPALSGFMVDADPTRRSLPFAPAAQLGGAALLPTISGELFAARGLDLVLLVCSVALVLSLLLLVAALAAGRHERRSAAPMAEG